MNPSTVYLVWIDGANRPFWNFYPTRARAIEAAKENRPDATFKIIKAEITYQHPITKIKSS